MDATIAGKWRYNLVFGLLLLAIPGLCVRMILLLSDDRRHRQIQASRQQRLVIPLPARPGTIFARSTRRYVPLAVSRQLPSCYADPFLLEDDELDEVSIQVGGALAMDPRDVQQMLMERRDKRFAWLKRRITDDEAKAVGELRMSGVGVAYEWQREYPSAQLAATVVGFRLIDGLPGGGLELTQDSYLAAADGTRVVLADASRRPIWPLAGESAPPRDGGHVFLCIDAVMQGFLQEAVAASVEKFDARWGTGVLVDPQSGEILAMCSVPTYDPNRFNEAAADTMTNRAISVPFEPGSVFKPLIAAAAVESGAVSYDTQIFCENGEYYAPRGGHISDHGQSYGYLTVADGVVHSSNICMAKVGEKLGNDLLYRIVKRFGLGEPTRIELPGESRGIVRAPSKWDTYSLRRVPFGQEISVTAIQLTMAFSALVNGGVLLGPRLVDRITDADGNVLYQSSRRVLWRVVTPSVAAQTLTIMRDVVERGTGKNCRLDDWTTFGKTGTAQIAGQGGYAEGAYVGSFVGGAPVGQPRLLCLISIYWPDRSKGYYGSTVAAPYVRQVLQKSLEYLHVPPDKRQALANVGRGGPAR